MKQEIVTDRQSRPTGRVLLVSNRLPTTGSGSDGHARPSSGGLAAGLRQVARRWPAVWLGWDGLARAESTGAREMVQRSEHGVVVALAMSEGEVARFYRRYCNGLLWPVLHGRIGDVPADEGDWESYQAMNRRFAEAVLRQLRPGDRIWVHDYHLMLLPSLLRQQTDAPIGFFLHTAFPEPEAFRTLPQARQLFRGLLAADVIGLHTEPYAANFLRTAAALGYRLHGSSVVTEHAARVQVHPMGIDVDAFAALSRDRDVLDDTAGIRRGRRQLLVGVDRLDYTKGIPQRLLAFEMLLEKYPRLRGVVSFFQLAVPTREEIAAYRELRQVVEALVRRINDRFGRGGWLPVEYVYGSLDLGSLAALYRAADVMVVTPVRDGLNLVAKEFVATRTDGDGVLVLSRFAGAAEELEAALQVDPNKIGQLAETLRTALTMAGRERRRRMRALRRAIAANTVFDWAGDFLDALGQRASAPAARAMPARRRAVAEAIPVPATAWAARAALATS